MNKSQFQYTKCYVAFLDILGFRKLVEKGDAKDIEILVAVLDEAANLEASRHGEQQQHYHQGTVTAGETQEWAMQIRSFSDSIVLFIPVESNGLSSVFSQIRYLHDRMIELGCLLRGAVTLGDMYWDETWSILSSSAEKELESVVEENVKVVWDRNTRQHAFITFGPAHNQAYELEKETAIYPRVILSDVIMQHMKEMSQRKPERTNESVHFSMKACPLCLGSVGGWSRTLLDFIRQDFDGIRFLDMFHRDINRKDTRRILEKNMEDGTLQREWIRDNLTYEDFIGRTRSTIERLLKVECSEKIHAKHVWLANYLNASLMKCGMERISID